MEEIDKLMHKTQGRETALQSRTITYEKNKQKRIDKIDDEIRKLDSRLDDIGRKQKILNDKRRKLVLQRDRMVYE